MTIPRRCQAEEELCHLYALSPSSTLFVAKLHRAGGWSDIFRRSFRSRTLTEASNIPNPTFSGKKHVVTSVQILQHPPISLPSLQKKILQKWSSKNIQKNPPKISNMFPTCSSANGAKASYGFVPTGGAGGFEETFVASGISYEWRYPLVNLYWT